MLFMKKLFALGILLGGFGLAACDEADGPAERAGEQVDEAIQDTKRAVDDATD